MIRVQDLFTFYLSHFDDEKKHFIIQKEYTGITIGKGMWNDFIKSKIFLINSEKSIISYFGDELINEFNTEVPKWYIIRKW